MQQTFPQYFTTDPVFEQGFVFLVVNPDADDLVVKILDTKHKEKEIASAVVRVSDIIKKPGMNFKKQPVTLKVGSFFVVGENVASVALLQGSTSGCTLPYVDIQTNILKHNFQGSVQPDGSLCILMMNR